MLALIIVALAPTPIVHAETPAIAVAGWHGEYYDNPNLIGMATLVREDEAIDFDWNYYAPADEIPDDGFSARWSRVQTFEQGLYRFHTTADDGLRLYVDGDVVIDEWHGEGLRTTTQDRQMAAGEHAVRVEYCERDGVALAQVGWDKVDISPDWKGEYWPNVDLAGRPTVVRHDPALGFDWWEESPDARLPSDGFSARWTRALAFESGTYRFHALVDDGVRLWLDDWLILDAWSDHDSAELTTDYVLARGTYTVKVEYYERIGQARLHLWWELVPWASYPDWKGEYWSNRALSGDPVLVRNDPAVDFDWGMDAPSLGLPEDRFSVRWTREEYFHPATYRFHLLADDGVRLWVDDRLLIDAWHDGEPRELTAEVAIASGTRRVRVEYYEHIGEARVHLWWRKVRVSYPDWKGEYWSNRDLAGDPALVRNDHDLDFDWRSGAPAAGLPDDDFSVRWSREVTYRSGHYRFYAWADDGIRVYVDGRLVIDEWHLSKGDEVYETELYLGGTRRVVVEYYERGGGARVRFWWKRLGD
jgi:hypothetical protein